MGKIVLLGILLVFALSALFAWPVMLLWNSYLVPSVTVVKSIDFMTAWGLSILFSLLFKNWNVSSN